MSHWHRLISCQQSVCFDGLRQIFFFLLLSCLVISSIAKTLQEKCQWTENKVTLVHANHLQLQLKNAIRDNWTITAQKNSFFSLIEGRVI